MMYLSEALKVNSTLAELQMNSTQDNIHEVNHFWHFVDWRIGNKVGDEGAKYLSEALQMNTALTDLSLYSKWCLKVK